MNQTLLHNEIVLNARAIVKKDFLVFFLFHLLLVKALCIALSQCLVVVEQVFIHIHHLPVLFQTIIAFTFHLRIVCAVCDLTVAFQLVVVVYNLSKRRCIFLCTWHILSFRLQVFESASSSQRLDALQARLDSNYVRIVSTAHLEDLLEAFQTWKHLCQL